jgi:NAD(P)-dependent dehydrogenase (short-subunit alcohol dehydrogenase family)
MISAFRTIHDAGKRSEDILRRRRPTQTQSTYHRHRKESSMQEKRGEGYRSGGMFDLAGKVALITGGGRGLGRIYCEALAEYGADISAADLDEKGIFETAEIVRAFGRKALAVKADVTNPEQVQQLVSETVTKLGRIDVLINNAGISLQAARIADMAIEDWDRVIAVNLRSVFLCTRAVLPIMVKQKKGNIINIASVRGISPSFEAVLTSPKAHYAASKGAIISFTKEAALEYARDGIRVNCIAPGHHGKGPGSRWRDPEETRKMEEQVARITPLGRIGDPAELKGLAVYLASDASSFVTGQVFVSDGGRCI